MSEKAKMLHKFTRQYPHEEHSYSYSPAHERHVTWLKTPAGTLVRESVYYQAAGSGKVGWCFTRRWGEESSREAVPFEKPMSAIQKLMKDIDCDMNRAAEILELDGQW